MQQSANATTFRAAPAEVQAKVGNLLHYLHGQQMACRVEMAGHELVVIIGTGLPTANYWINRLQID